MQRHMKAKCGQIQTYRHLTFLGRVARLPSDRDLRWWAWFGARLPAATGGQSSRRRRAGVPCKGERAAAEALRMLATTSQHWQVFTRAAEQFVHEEGDRLPPPSQKTCRLHNLRTLGRL